MIRRGRLVNLIRSIPVLGEATLSVLTSIRRTLFRDSFNYWESRYARSGTSGTGSYGDIARFKADVLNTFVREHKISSVIEFGCGDGNQLALAHYPAYTGLDISRSAMRLCKERFARDHTKSFFLYDPECFVDSHSALRAELAISLDVIYHVVEDRIFHLYLTQLFAASSRYIIIFSSDTDENPRYLAPHVKHRNFSSVVRQTMPEWSLLTRIPNKLAYQGDELTRLAADFYIYERARVPEK